MNDLVWQWLDRAFDAMPGCDDDLFKRLWNRQVLRYLGSSPEPDTIDIHNARLVSASVRQRERLFVLLPDFQTRRPALLFATALLRYWFDHRTLSIGQSRPILYFGSHVGIRQQLRLIEVGNLALNLGAVFSQQDLTRSRSTAALGEADASSEALLRSRIPEAITVYAPADPVSIVQDVKPAWVAIDTGESPEAQWLEPLLSYAERTAMPVVAWGQNPLSNCADAFDRHCTMFRWPAHAVKDSGEVVAPIADLRDVLSAQSSHTVQPLVLDGNHVGAIASALAHAARKLITVAGPPGSGLVEDAIGLHWWYLRSNEMLCVPTDLYEAEAPKIWGLRSLVQLRAACEHFRHACRSPYKGVANALDDVAGIIDGASDQFNKVDPPLWTALCNLCLEDSPRGTARIIAFPNHARSRLFQFALLSRFNVSEDDLEQLRVWVVSFRDLRLIHASTDRREADSSRLRNASWRPLIVGLPTARSFMNSARLLREPSIEFLVYEHQVSGVARLTREWNRRLTTNIGRELSAVHHLSELQESPPPFADGQPLFAMNEPLSLRVESGARKAAPQLRGLLNLESPSAEVAALLDPSVDEDVESDVIQERESDGEPEGVEAYTDFAVLVHFSDGWQGFFSPEETINVIVATGSGVKTDERHVRALKAGDRVVLIHGAKRQSLYELIIARVHKHPAIELHLALIRRWQEDFRSAFQRWQAIQPRTLSDLRQELARKGSALTSAYTLYHWLQGWTLCPQDAEDILRTAQILDMGFVMKNYRAIDKAAKRIRGLHVGLATRLSRWLAERGAGLASRGAEDVIDAELGLTFADFRNSLVVADVLRIETVQGPFLRSKLGRISTEESR